MSSRRPNSKLQAVCRYFLVELILFAFVNVQSRPFLFGRQFILESKNGDCFRARRDGETFKVCGSYLRVGQSILLDNGRSFKVVGKTKNCFDVLRNSRAAKICNTNLRVGQSVLLDTRTQEVVSKNVLLLVLSIALVCFFIGWLWYAF